jgi:hypothetical protein
MSSKLSLRSVGEQEDTAKTKAILGCTLYSVQLQYPFFKNICILPRAPVPLWYIIQLFPLLIPPLCLSGSTSAVFASGWSCRGPATPAPSAGPSSPGSVFSISFYMKPFAFLSLPSIYPRTILVKNGPPASLP